MKNSLMSGFTSVLCGTILCFSSCVVNTVVSDMGVPVLDIAENYNASVSEPLNPENYSYVQLDSKNQDAFFKNGKILDVISDTVVILEDDFEKSRIIMFDINDGNYLGQVSHQGQGPGEYRIIAGAFVDKINQEVVLPDFDRPIVNVYSLKTGELNRSFDRDSIEYRMDPIGSFQSCVNVAQVSPENLTIYQYDSKFERIDSVVIPNFKGGAFSTIWDNAGNDGIIMVSDTIYDLKPGKLNPVAILDGGKYFITADQEQEVMERIMTTGESELEILSPYMLVRNVQFTDNVMMLTTMYGNSKFSDFYDLRDGKLIYRYKYDELSKPNCVVLRDNKGRGMHVERVFAKNGMWYGFVDEGDAAEIAGSELGDTNCAIVSFEISN